MTLAHLKVADYDVIGSAHIDDIGVLRAPMSVVLTQELDGACAACAALGVSVEDVLLAALGRAIARTIGQGVVCVDVGQGRSIYPIALSCVGPEQKNATEMLTHVHRTAATAFLDRLVFGISDDKLTQPAPEIQFVYCANDAVRLAHALRLSTYRVGDFLALDWWYDTRSFEPYTVRELSEQFPYALIELTSEAMGPVLVPGIAVSH